MKEGKSSEIGKKKRDELVGDVKMLVVIVDEEGIIRRERRKLLSFRVSKSECKG